MIGGRNIAYATTPIINRTGITIGGTRYFMTFRFVRERGGADYHVLARSAEAAARLANNIKAHQ